MDKLAFKKPCPCGGSLKDGSLAVCFIFTVEHFYIIIKLTVRLQEPSKNDQIICVVILGFLWLLLGDIVFFRGLQRMIPAYVCTWVILNGAILVHATWISFVFMLMGKIAILHFLLCCAHFYMVLIPYSYYWRLQYDDMYNNENKI